MFINLLNREFLRALGLAIIIIGAPLGMYMNYFISNSSWSNILMLMGVLLIVSYRNLFEFKFPSYSKAFLGVIVFHLICFLSMQFTENFRYIHLHFFALALMIALMSTRINKLLNIDLIVRTVWILSLICSFLFLFCIITGIYAAQMRSLFAYQDGTNILEPITMANVCSMNIISSFLVRARNNWEKYVIATAIILDFYCIFHTGKRSFFFIGFMSLFFYIWKYKLWSKIISLNGVMFIIALVVGVSIVFFQNKEINEMATRMWERFINGINDMVTGSDTSGGSAVARYEQRQMIVDYISTNFQWYNYLFGSGYFTFWSDLPYLQCYLDFGIYGFCTFMYYVFFLPLKTLWKVSTKNYMLICAAFICMPSTLQVFNSMHPYNYSNWTQVGFLLFVMANQKRITKLLKNSKKTIYGRKN